MILKNNKDSFVLMNLVHKAKLRKTQLIFLIYGIFVFTFSILYDGSNINPITFLIVITILLLLFVLLYKVVIPWSIRKFLFTDSLTFYSIHVGFVIGLLILILYLFYGRIVIFPAKLYEFTWLFNLSIWALIATMIVNVVNLICLIDLLYDVSDYNNKNIIIKREKDLIIGQQQINPHYLLNVLSNLQYLIRSDQKEQALNYNSGFIQLFSFQLDFANREYITVEEELNWLKSYIETERSRTNYRFNFEIKIESQEIILNQIPPLLLQPIIENSIIHGFSSNMNNNFYLELNFSEVEHDYLSITITDNGIGIKSSENLQSKGKSIALKNINERIEKINAIGKFNITLSNTLNENGSFTELRIKKN